MGRTRVHSLQDQQKKKEEEFRIKMAPKLLREYEEKLKKYMVQNEMD